jgi:hypothetical protein
LLEAPEQPRFTFGPTMSEEDVIAVIMEAVSKGHVQNAPRGTLLIVHELAQEDADRLGVSEVKVSIAPDGRILSAYPSRGWNVLALRKLSPEEQAQQAAAAAAMQAAQNGSQDDDDRLFKTNIASTTFG